MTPLRVPPSGSASRSPPSRGTQETNHSAFSQPPRPCREPAELGSAPGCYPCCSPVYHFAAEQMDDTEATFFSPSSGKMNLTKCCRHRPTRSHIHRNPEPLTEHRPRASGPLWGPRGENGDKTNILHLLLSRSSFSPARSVHSTGRPCSAFSPGP